MPKNSKDILSNAQSNIGDFSGDILALGEYISSLNDVAKEIAQETQVWIARTILQARKLGYDWSESLTYNAGDIVLYSGSYFICILSHTNNIPPNAIYWLEVTEWDTAITYQEGDYVYYGDTVTFYKAATGNSASQPPSANWYLYGVALQNEYKVNLPASFKPYKITRVLKVNSSVYTEMIEYSIQAVGRQSSNNRPFPINDISFTDGFSTQNMNDFNYIPGQMDNSLTLNFSSPLSISDYIYIDYIQGTPFELETWNVTPAILIPDFLVDSFTYGLTYKLLERRFFRGNASLERQMVEARQQYKGRDPSTKLGGALYKAKAYARNFKSEEHGAVVRPFKFLAESGEYSFEN